MSKEYLHEIFCSIQPHRNKFFKLGSNFNVTTSQYHEETDASFIQHMIINSAEALPNCSKYFPKITELTLHDKDIIQRKSYLMDNLRHLLLLQESKDYQLVSKQNQVKTNIIQGDYTKKMMEVLIYICPRVQYISLSLSDRSLDATVHYLLLEINDATLHLFSLCIRVASPHWIKYWKMIIQLKLLIQAFTYGGEISCQKKTRFLSFQSNKSYL
ncbi:unnamed protein product [Adineta steineri]|uniref:Uncharacterized protein n=1 Tax=Adineta steineri TaxID=433720 RepID=A0A813MUC7_9BILA|nr:unnamed protein product [Adineta steineri]